MGSFLLFCACLISLWYCLRVLPRQIDDLREENEILRQHLEQLDWHVDQLMRQDRPPHQKDRATTPDPAPATVADPQSATVADPQPASVCEPESLEFDLPETETPPTLSPASPVSSRPAPAQRQTTEMEWNLPASDIPGIPEQARIPEEEPSLWARALAWFAGGNTVVHLGALLLFLGLAFLLRYASLHFSLPMPLRYLGVTGAGAALLAIGWRLRLRRPAYGLSLQGAGIAILYLTTLSALHLHGYLSAEFSLAVLILLTGALIFLALLQDAAVLANIAVLGAFAAPILTQLYANPELLFGYFALLDAAIVLIALQKQWRTLDWIGFAATFGIGAVWGMAYYQPEMFPLIESFVILFFLMFAGVGLCFACRNLQAAADAPADADRAAWQAWSSAHARRLDGALLFGPPLLGFGLQYAIVSTYAYGAAWSALALALFYGGVFLRLRREPRFVLLQEICMALGLIFATLAVPLAFSASWTSAAWAVEAAGLYWLGLRQNRTFARALALLLLPASALSYLSGITFAPSAEFMLIGSPLGAAMLSAALLFCWQSQRTNPENCAPIDRAARILLVTGGLAFAYLVIPLACTLATSRLLWAGAALGTLWLGLRLRERVFCYMALALYALDSFSLLPLRAAYLPLLSGHGPAPWLGAAFWTPVCLALAALGSAWALWRRATLGKNEADDPETLDLVHIWLLGGLVWWIVGGAYALSTQFARPLPLLLPLLTLSALCWQALARIARWPALAVTCLLPILALCLLLLDNPAAWYEALRAWPSQLDAKIMALAYPLALVVHYRALKMLAAQLPKFLCLGGHALGAWLGLALLSATLYAYSLDAEWLAAWRSLALAAAPAAYLAWVGGQNVRGWPWARHPHVYAHFVAVTVALALCFWWLHANFTADGAFGGLWLPLLNPLELGLLATLWLLARWRKNRLDIQDWRPEALALFALVSVSVCRTAHHWLDIPFTFPALFASMTVQASWSILWTLIALALMRAGSRQGQRRLWFSGAALIGVVVIKLFLIELGSSSGLARIVSFIGVGALLLIIGYIAPPVLTDGGARRFGATNERED